MVVSSNTLFHFTKDLDTIKNILSDGLFWPIYCIEYDKGPNVDGTFNAFPMVCFCDIPLSQISEHLLDYGKYGIGINKQWGKEKYLLLHTIIIRMQSCVRYTIGFLQPLRRKTESFGFLC